MRVARIVAPAAGSPGESTKCEKHGFCGAQRNKKPPK